MSNTPQTDEFAGFQPATPATPAAQDEFAGFQPAATAKPAPGQTAYQQLQQLQPKTSEDWDKWEALRAKDIQESSLGQALVPVARKLASVTPSGVGQAVGGAISSLGRGIGDAASAVTGQLPYYGKSSNPLVQYGSGALNTGGSLAAGLGGGVQSLGADIAQTAVTTEAQEAGAKAHLARLAAAVADNFDATHPLATLSKVQAALERQQGEDASSDALGQAHIERLAGEYGQAARESTLTNAAPNKDVAAVGAALPLVATPLLRGAALAAGAEEATAKAAAAAANPDVAELVATAADPAVAAAQKVAAKAAAGSVEQASAQQLANAFKLIPGAKTASTLGQGALAGAKKLGGVIGNPLPALAAPAAVGGAALAGAPEGNANAANQAVAQGALAGAGGAASEVLGGALKTPISFAQSKLQGVFSKGAGTEPPPLPPVVTDSRGVLWTAQGEAVPTEQAAAAALLADKTVVPGTPLMAAKRATAGVEPAETAPTPAPVETPDRPVPGLAQIKGDRGAAAVEEADRLADEAALPLAKNFPIGRNVTGPPGTKPVAPTGTPPLPPPAPVQAIAGYNKGRLPLAPVPTEVSAPGRSLDPDLVQRAEAGNAALAQVAEDASSADAGYTRVSSPPSKNGRILHGTYNPGAPDEAIPGAEGQQATAKAMLTGSDSPIRENLNAFLSGNRSGAGEPLQAFNIHDEPVGATFSILGEPAKIVNRSPAGTTVAFPKRSFEMTIGDKTTAETKTLAHDPLPDGTTETRFDQLRSGDTRTISGTPYTVDAANGAHGILTLKGPDGVTIPALQRTQLWRDPVPLEMSGPTTPIKGSSVLNSYGEPTPLPNGKVMLSLVTSKNQLLRYAVTPNMYKIFQSLPDNVPAGSALWSKGRYFSNEIRRLPPSLAVPKAAANQGPIVAPSPAVDPQTPGPAGQ